MSKHDSLTETIVDEVAESTNTDPLELDPLHNVIDVDALEDLFAPKLDEQPRSGGTIVFIYGGCTVIVRGSDQVTVRLGTKERV